MGTVHILTPKNKQNYKRTVTDFAASDRLSIKELCDIAFILSRVAEEIAGPNSEEHAETLRFLAAIIEQTQLVTAPGAKPLKV